jgi:hypothetical protein
MGNRRPDLARELPWLDGAAELGTIASPRSTAGPTRRRLGGLRGRIAQSPRIRRWLKALNRKSYELLYPG